MAKKLSFITSTVVQYLPHKSISRCSVTMPPTCFFSVATNGPPPNMEPVPRAFFFLATDDDRGGQGVGQVRSAYPTSCPVGR